MHRPQIFQTSHAPVLEPLETRTLLSAVEFVGKHVYQDSAGSTVTVTLTGGGGGQVVFPGESVNNADPSLVIMPGGPKSTLTITVKGASKTATTVIDGIAVTDDRQLHDAPIKAIKAPTVTLVGTLTLDASSGATITLGSVGTAARPAEILLSGTAEKTVTTLTLGNVWPGSRIAAGGVPLALSATDMRDTSVTAKYFTKITSQSTTGVTLTALSADTRHVSIGRMTVGRDFDGDIHAPGRVASLTAGSILGGTITADSIGSLTVKGYRIGPVSHLGHLMSTIMLSGVHATKGITLGTVKVANSLSNSEITVLAGSIGTVTVGDSLFTSVIVARDRIAKVTAGEANASDIQARTIGAVTINGRLQFTTIEATGHDSKGLSIGRVKVVGEYTAGFVLAPTGRITSLTMGSINAATIEALSIGSLAVKGAAGSRFSYILDRKIAIDIGVDAKGVSIGKLTVRESFYGDIRVAGQIGRFAMGTVDGGGITAGSIGTLTVKGYKTRDGQRYSGAVAAPITLTRDHVPTGKNTLGSATITSSLQSPLTVTGNAGTISVAVLNASLLITGQAKTVRLPSSMLSSSPTGGSGKIQIQGGGKVLAKNGKLDIYGGNILYVM